MKEAKEYNFLEAVNELDDIVQCWVRDEMDDRIEEAKADVANNEIWLKGAEKSDKLMFEENLERSKQFLEFLTNLRAILD